MTEDEMVNGITNSTDMLLLLLSRFSRVRLCATPQTSAHQAPPSLGFSRQEHWSGLPFPSPVHESETEREVAQSCLTLRDPMDCSLPGSSAPGIFQARVLEWVAIAFSKWTPGTVILSWVLQGQNNFCNNTKMLFMLKMQCVHYHYLQRNQ